MRHQPLTWCEVQTPFPFQVQVMYAWHAPSQRTRLVGIRIEPRPGHRPEPIDNNVLRRFPIRSLLRELTR
jgi:hypothetical protein